MSSPVGFDQSRCLDLARRKAVCFTCVLDATDLSIRFHCRQALNYSLHRSAVDPCYVEAIQSGQDCWPTVQWPFAGRCENRMRSSDGNLSSVPYVCSRVSIPTCPPSCPPRLVTRFAILERGGASSGPSDALEWILQSLNLWILYELHRLEINTRMSKSFAIDQRVKPCSSTRDC